MRENLGVRIPSLLFFLKQRNSLNEQNQSAYRFRQNDQKRILEKTTLKNMKPSSTILIFK